MSWATRDLREPILKLFVEVQEPWQHELVNEIIRLVGCQGLRDAAAKLKWARANKAKQNAYSAKYTQRNRALVSARQRARRQRAREVCT